MQKPFATETLGGGCSLVEDASSWRVGCVCGGSSEGVMEAAWWQRSVSSGSIDGESR